MTARAIRNNNPCDLTDAGIDWQGLASERSDQAQYPGRTNSARFVHLFYGLRAGCIDIFGDIIGRPDRPPLDTPAKLAADYAPLGDEKNNPTEYASFIAQRLHITPDSPFRLSAHADALILAICKDECGLELADAYPDLPTSSILRAAVSVAKQHLNL